MVRQFITDVVEERAGFSLDRPHRLGEKSLSVLVPVIRETKEKRDYITFAEAKKVVVKDTGRVSQVNVKNEEALPLYVSRGEIFKGDTQERAAIHGYLIPAGKQTNVAVRCIHLSKGVNSGAEMSYGGRVPYYVDLSNQHKTWNSIDPNRSAIAPYGGLYGGGITGSEMSMLGGTGNTGDIVLDGIKNWTSTSTTTYSDDYSINCNYYAEGQIGVTGQPGEPGVTTIADYTVSVDHRSDDLINTIEVMSDNIKDAMKNIPFIENQVGGIFLDGSGNIIGLDIYDIPASWQSVKNDVIKKEGASFVDDEDDLFVMRPEKVAKIIAKKLKEEFVEKVIYSGDYTISEIRYENLIGEVVYYNNKVIHLTLWKV